MALVAMATVDDEEEEKWIMHYSSYHQILLVGEGDFSFSLCLALAFGSASTICASSRDSYDTVIQKYKRAKSNLVTLVRLGACILHGVDATEMKLCSDLKMRKFDRIIFNFPHAGFYGRETNRDLIRMHRSLVQGFFQNASGMLRAGGEIHVSHKTKFPYSEWNIEELARESSLSLIECPEFKIEDYPGYNNKRGGDDTRCDEHFSLGECRTFIFEFFPADMKKFGGMSCNGFTSKRSQPFQEFPFKVRKQKISHDVTYPRMFSTTLNIQRERPQLFESFEHPQRSFPRNTNILPGLPLASEIESGNPRSYHGCFNYVNEMLRGVGNDPGYPVPGRTLNGYSYLMEELHRQRYMPEAPGRTLNGYSYLMEELHRQRSLKRNKFMDRVTLARQQRIGLVSNHQL